MKFAAFKRIARVISQEELDEFVMLIGMFGSDRAFVNEVDVAGRRAQVTAKNVISQWASLDELRIDNIDRVYMLKSLYDRVVLEAQKDTGRSRMRRREDELNRGSQVQLEISGAPPPLPEKEPEPEPEVREPSPEPVDSNEPPPLPECKPWEAEGEDLQMIHTHNNWLKEHGRSDDQVIPF